MPLSLLEGALGGIGLFLLGMRILSDGIRTVADDRIRSVFARITSNRFYSALFGIALSFSLNSVNAAVIFSIGLLNGGMLNAYQALSVLGGVLVGAALALHVPGIPYSVVATPLVFLGVVLKFFARRRRFANSGDLLLGAGLLFLGLTLLEGSFRPYESHPFYNAFDGVFFKNPLLASLFGSVIACFVQSSTSLNSVITSLVSSYSVNPEIAFEMALGGSLGVALIGLLASIGGTSVSRNVATAFLGTFLGLNLRTIEGRFSYSQMGTLYTNHRGWPLPWTEISYGYILVLPPVADRFCFPTAQSFDLPLTHQTYRLIHLLPPCSMRSAQFAFGMIDLILGVSVFSLLLLLQIPRLRAPTDTAPSSPADP